MDALILLPLIMPVLVLIFSGFVLMRQQINFCKDDIKSLTKKNIELENKMYELKWKVQDLEYRIEWIKEDTKGKK